MAAANRGVPPLESRVSMLISVYKSEIMKKSYIHITATEQGCLLK